MACHIHTIVTSLIIFDCVVDNRYTLQNRPDQLVGISDYKAKRYYVHESNSLGLFSFHE